MNGYCTVSQYAAMHGKDPGNIRRMLIKGVLLGEKMGNQWILAEDTPYPEDGRVKTGNYRNWRKRANVWQKNPELIKGIMQMCHDLSTIYGDLLDKVVLYGSYARGEQTDESDVDIAVILKNGVNEKIHDKMTDIVVDYEIEVGRTLSVISVEHEQYEQWKTVLPFYKNIDREGIVLWKASKDVWEEGRS